MSLCGCKVDELFSFKREGLTIKSLRTKRPDLKNGFVLKMSVIPGQSCEASISIQDGQKNDRGKYKMSQFVKIGVLAAIHTRDSRFNLLIRR